MTARRQSFTLPLYTRKTRLLAAATLLGCTGLHARAQATPATEQLSPVQSAPAVTSAPATTQGGTIRGSVKAGVIPLPGVAVTASNTLTGKRYSTTTDVTGTFAMTIPRTGRYVVRAELAAFAPLTREVRITTEAVDQTAEFSLELASRAATRASTAEDSPITGSTIRALAGALGRGTQSLSVTGGLAGEDTTASAQNSGTSLPSLGALGDAGGATESVAISGQAGQTNGLANFSEDEIRQRVTDAIDQARRQGGANGVQADAVVGMLGNMMAGPGGSFGGGGGRGGPGGGGGRGGGGGFRGFNPTQPHGALFYIGDNSHLDAAPFSISGLPTANPGYNRNSFGLSFTGSPYLPGLTKPNPKQFIFFNVSGSRNTSPVILTATVPTPAERTGDFSQLFQTVSSTGSVASTQQVAIYDPATGRQFCGNTSTGVCTTPNVIPASRLSPQALALLNYYPAPNIPNAAQTNNYQTVTTAGQNSTNASLRFVRNFGQQQGFGGRGGGGGGRRNANTPPALRQNINFNASYTHSAADNRNVFLPLGGATDSDGYGLTAGYTVGYGRLNNNASLNWNRSHALTRNYFTNGASDPSSFVQSTASTQLASNPFFFGAPNLTFSGFTGLTQATPSDSVNQTISFSDFISYNHKRHNMRFGFDIRRVHADSIGGTDVFGALTFTGYATQAPASVACTPTSTVTCTQQPASGSGFADFLLGLPQQSTIQAGLNKIYLRENVYDGFAQDDWRTAAGLTLNYGLRYEYFGPYSEKNNRLVNLDHNATFTQVDAVQPGQTGLFGGPYNTSLVNPDRALFSPRLGFAYQPKFLPKLTKSMVVRGGYGLNFNTGQYATFARQLAFQPPFALTQTNIVGQQGCTASNLTLSAAFGCSTAATQNNYSVNKNYRLGHVQVFNLDIQKTLPLQTVLNIGYNGSVGGALDIVRAPNRTATGLLDSSAQSFLYEDSLGYSRLNALAVNLRKRQQKGISIQATYQYRHSLDNASSINGTGNTVAQNDLDLNAEEGNSSFVQRHTLNGNWVIELPFGPNRAFFSKGGFWSKALDGFNISGDYNFTSGLYYTPTYVATVNETATGVTNSRRPNRNFAIPIAGAGRFFRGQQNSAQICPNLCWFNTGAFTDPGTSFGTASRGSIEGPGTQTIDGSLSRTVQLSETRSFEARLTATNPLNTVQYNGINTVLNSPTFGQINSVASRRKVTFTARYRF